MSRERIEGGPTAATKHLPVTTVELGAARGQKLLLGRRRDEGGPKSATAAGLRAG